MRKFLTGLMAVCVSGLAYAAPISVGNIPKASTVTSNRQTMVDSVLYESSSNIGIGSHTPRAKLEVDGGLYALNVGVNSISPTASLEIKKNASLHPLFVTNSLGGDYFTVRSSGNVGIGSTEPTALLDIAGSTGVGIGASPGAYLDVGGGTKTYIDGTNDALIKDDLEVDSEIYAQGGLRVDGAIYFNGSTGQIATDATTGRISYFNKARRSYTKHIAQSITITTGSGGSAFSALQTAVDGSIYDITEATGAPGIDAAIYFTGVTSFEQVRFAGCYAGTTTHAVALQLYNHSTNAWNTFGSLQNAYCDVSTSGGNILENKNFFIYDDTNYVRADGRVWLRLYHTVSGNASHHLYLDEVSIRQ